MGLTSSLPRVDKTIVPDEPSPFESWGRRDTVTDAPLPERSTRSPAISARARGPVLAALLAAVICAGVVLTAEIASVGPFAPAPMTGSLASAATPLAPAGSAPSRPPSGLPGGQWQWQWIATGTPVGHSGPLEVRAWQLSRVCGAHGACHVEFARQLEDPLAPAELTDRTTLTPGYDTPTSVYYNAQFAPVPSSCSEGSQSRQAQLSDHFELGWTASSRALVANENETWTSCFGASYGYVNWTATRVRPPQLPALVPDRQHAASARAFRAAAEHTCTAMNSAAEPLARNIASDQLVIRSAAGNAAKARAEANIASELAPLVPLAVEEYTMVPQPPAGALDRLWLRDVSLNRVSLPPVAAALAALQAAADDVSRFDRTGKALYQQTGLAEVSLFENDILASAAAGTASEHIERGQLHLPPICITQPAIASIFNTPAQQTV